jgi:uncharacterized protein (TIGR03118 family)
MRPTRLLPHPLPLSYVVVALISAGAVLGGSPSAHAMPFVITDLVTDDNANLTSLGFPMAGHVDPNLVNPGGISFAPTSPFWVSDNGAGIATLYNAAGVPNALVVTVAAPAGSPPEFVSSPTGTVFNNNNSDFIVSDGVKTGSANFLFATENGTISGRSAAISSTQSFIGVDNSASGAVYKGLAITPISGQNVLFAANFHSGMVEEYDSSFALVRAFTDPALPPVPPGTPAGQSWAPFNVQVLNGRLYVSFALQDDAKHDDVAGSGNGFVDLFGTDGTFVKRLVNTGAGDPLDSPWGLTIAPAGFGLFGGDLLVGNFGDGTIDVFDPVSGTSFGMLEGPDGPIGIPGLWDLTIGNGGPGVDPDAIYFTAGLPDAAAPDVLEQAGLFGRLDPVPEIPTIAFLISGLACLVWLSRRRVTVCSAEVGTTSA